MSRLNLNDIADKQVQDTHEDLDDLIRSYAFNKEELDSYKKLCDRENSEIKKLMTSYNEEQHNTDNIIVKKVIQHKESMNEDKLLTVLKKFNVPCVKTVEVVDMELLESYLYHNTDTLPEGLADALNACKSTSEVVTLRISKK